jgi:serine protease inhibitor
MKKALLAAAGLIVAIAALALLMSKPAEPPAGGPTPEAPIGRETPDETYAVNGSAFSAAGLGGFAVELYRRLALGGLDRNLVVSPYSVYKAFAMAYAGAAGETREEIKRVFGFGEDPCAVEKAGRGVVEAASVWLQRDMYVADAYLKAVACLGAEARRVDFKNNYRSALAEINRWIAEKTRGYVKDLIPADYPRGEDIRAVLVSALFFNGSWWPDRFSRIGKREFQGAGPVEYMALDLRSCGDPSLRGRVTPELTVVELPFKDTDVAMYVVMPASLREYVEGLTYEKLRGDLSALTDEVVRVEMPLFQAQFKGSVKPVLAEMGVRLAFEPDRADFSPMTGGRERLRIDDVFHGAYIRADENGVVAAAATGAVAKVICAKIGGVEVVVDRPFLFVLADRKTGAIYFIGHVVDPSR